MEMKSSPNTQITYWGDDRGKKNQNLALMMWAGRVLFTSGEHKKAIRLSCGQWREPSRGGIRASEQMLDVLTDSPGR